ncbi:uncharacterized protein LOC124432469 [Vespa crabro]|uniref:uncharacterized protein LOC124432469 n=1 Tax=Vespa crabro TaxID=7445 RepID=UPI001EFFA87D|nr:uncharacterized protein LOC124432469 [Vespa crabro]
MTLIKITTCWKNRQALGRLLAEIQNNFIADKYNTFEKRFIFIKYTKMAKYYVLVAVTTMTFSTVFYYINALLPNVKMVISNSSLSYKLPYKTRTIGDIRDIRIYIFLCIYQMLVVPSIVLGFVGFDCLFANLAFHIAAQFGILSSMLKEILDDSNAFQHNIKELLLRHYVLIRQAKTLEDNFNVIILQQLVSTTFQLCSSAYNTILDSVSKETLTLIVFCFYALSTLSTLFLYCYIGECLIREVIELINYIQGVLYYLIFEYKNVILSLSIIDYNFDVLWKQDITYLKKGVNSMDGLYRCHPNTPMEKLLHVKLSFVTTISTNPLLRANEPA